MAESRTQITVALIGVAGIIATALIANGDKWFRSAPQRALVEQAPITQLPDQALGGPGDAARNRQTASTLSRVLTGLICVHLPFKPYARRVFRSGGCWYPARRRQPKETKC